MKKLYHFVMSHFRIHELLNNQQNLLNNQVEILKAISFNNTITDSEWLRYKNFSPGGWAADYTLLYTLYRVLNGIKPQQLLEFGLGQSSKMIHQYANYFKANAITCEHDEEWVKFFNQGRDGDYDINVFKVDLETVNYKGFETLSYKNAQNLFEGHQFDFILVDGPYGSDHYSRSQIINLAKNNLSKSFCIIIDDSEREGEKETIIEIENVLKDSKIDYCIRHYESTKRHTLICSQDYKFLTSL